MNIRPQTEIYLPLLKQFCKENLEELKNSSYPWAPFIPVAFPKYFDGETKNFFIGIDTYYWGVTASQLIDTFAKENLDDILSKGNKVVTPERILVEWKNNKGLFWSMVCRLQLFLKTGKIYSNEDLRHLSSSEQSIIREIGYGNLNAIELKSTLIKEEYWNSINQDCYKKIKKSSENLIDPLINLIKAYHPDNIFILGWGDNESHAFKGLQYTPLTQYYADGFRALYKLKDYSTKIVWTSHPSRYSYLGTNQEEMIPYLAEALNYF